MKKICSVLALLALVTGSVIGQTASNSETVPGENLVAEGIPKIPVSLAKTVSRYRGAYGYPLY
ncbi:MAG: hypothetical protein ACREDR_49040, partial [Blastocatellia bacterium]